MKHRERTNRQTNERPNEGTTKRTTKRTNNNKQPTHERTNERTNERTKTQTKQKTPFAVRTMVTLTFSATFLSLAHLKSMHDTESTFTFTDCDLLTLSKYVMSNDGHFDVETLFRQHYKATFAAKARCLYLYSTGERPLNKQHAPQSSRRSFGRSFVRSFVRSFIRSFVPLSAAAANAPNRALLRPSECFATLLTATAID